MTAPRIACAAAALTLALLASGEAWACLPSIDTPEQQAAQVRLYHAGYWNNATQVYLAEATEVATSWWPDPATTDVSPSGYSEVERPLTRVRLTPLLTLKGPEATEPVELSFTRDSEPVCTPPLWRDHTVQTGLGSRYIVYVRPDMPPLRGRIDTVRVEDLQDRATRSAWEAAARQARRGN
jgi:hypothetical protein